MKKLIYIVGLGPSLLGDITVETMQLLQSAEKVILRTEQHPSVTQLRENKLEFVSCDNFYESSDSFDEVYERIVNFCLQESRKYSKIVYAVPGSPLVAEKTVQLLRKKAVQENIAIKILPAMSFLDLVYSRLALDACDGLKIIDALQIETVQAKEKLPLIITQVYNKQVASNVKLTLMDYYNDETEIVFLRNLGLADERVEKIFLYELDRQPDINHLTTVYLPYDDSVNISELANTVEELRAPAGCLWDREQTHETIRHNFIEEVYEVVESIDDQNATLLCEELGDVLLQVVFHAQIAKEAGVFDLQDVIDGINDKLIRRHPHVFGKISVASTQDILKNWDKIKASEKSERKYVLDGVTKGLPALMCAYKLQSKAAKVGFDWQEIEPVYAKVYEELEEVKVAKNRQELEKELGDLLFAVTNLARHYRVVPELALNISNNCFRKRFAFVEQCVLNSGREWQNFSLQELDEFWEKAKLQ
ncbi:nucleoside triphosphate pyrophosphohydrolase [Succinispira mobilis]|uniref:nucleoside triphosphate pyrophosphohydrolase n=1 Tax=Succinispira mobilis TaxID=78120 RepID=UPI001FE118E6|nr:nucleoside triphosphate pyrophosphohydrolase [Succinispira mobilis]